MFPIPIFVTGTPKHSLTSGRFWLKCNIREEVQLLPTEKIAIKNRKKNNNNIIFRVLDKRKQNKVGEKKTTKSCHLANKTQRQTRNDRSRIQAQQQQKKNNTNGKNMK